METEEVMNDDPLNSINAFPPVLAEIKMSAMLPGQYGVFASRNLPDGTFLWEWICDEYPVSWQVFEELDCATKQFIKKFCLCDEEVFWYPSNPNLIPTMYHLNHCCDPNCGFNENGDLVTIREVKIGEELCYDYGMAHTYPLFHLVCKCGSKNCRGTITGNDWKWPEFQKRNRQWMRPELRLP